LKVRILADGRHVEQRFFERPAFAPGLSGGRASGDPSRDARAEDPAVPEKQAIQNDDRLSILHALGVDYLSWRLSKCPMFSEGCPDMQIRDSPIT
jgi:hypothetical protein